ncbi:MAG: DUF2905 domain-containing protein [bacterium]
METQHFGRLLIFVGVFIPAFAGTIAGLIFTVGPRFFPIGGLPGDITCRRGDFTLFFPLKSDYRLKSIIDSPRPSS